MKLKLLPVLALFFLLGCDNDEALMLTVNFDFGEVTFDANDGVVNAPEDTDITSLTPVIEISEGASVYSSSQVAIDFSETVTYTVTSEDQQNVAYYKVSVYLPIVKFMVYDCSSCSAENTTPEIASGATVSVFINTDGTMVMQEELETDENGEVLFYADSDEVYYVTVEKGSAYFTQDGYVIKGVIDSESTLDDYNYYMPDAEIGDLILCDVNGDGTLSDDDKLDYLEVWDDESDEATLSKTIYISE